MSSQIFPTRRTWNLLPNAEALDQWFTFGAGVSVTANAAVAPDGNTTADRIDYNGAGSAGDIRLYTASVVYPTVIGQLYTMSMHLKANTGAVDLALEMNGGGALVPITLSSSWQRFSVSGYGDGVSYGQMHLRSRASSNAAFSVYGWGGNITTGGLVEYSAAVGDNTLFPYVVPGSFRRQAVRRVVKQSADSDQEYRSARGAQRFLYSMDLEGMPTSAVATLQAFWDAHETWDRFQLEDPITKTLRYVRFNMDGLEVAPSDTFDHYSASLEFISLV